TPSPRPGSRSARTTRVRRSRGSSRPSRRPSGASARYHRSTRI
ncbi:MAG: hypothetical protein AVDCRST_MAG05-4592, partial [uncultured Rubrobacteraceae bacterium]